jgi:nucleoside-diphosphate-sugar epimerase
VAQEKVMNRLNIFGGFGFVGSAYTKMFYDAALGNIAHVNRRDDHKVYSADILYLLSTVHNYHIFDDPHRDINTNLNTLVTVLENWKEYQASTGEKGVFNFISSWSVYGNQKDLPVNESAVCDPHGWYIITKRCAEQLLVEYCTTFGLQYRILRFSNIVGLGDAKVSAKKNTLQNAINLLAVGKDVELFGDGLFHRDFMHVDDCVRAVELVMAKGNVNEIYNIGNGKTWLYNDILTYVQDKLQSTLGNVVYKEPTEFQKKVPVVSFYMDVTKLHNLGFVPKYTGKRLYDSLIPTQEK